MKKMLPVATFLFLFSLLIGVMIVSIMHTDNAAASNGNSSNIHNKQENFQKEQVKEEEVLGINQSIVPSPSGSPVPKDRVNISPTSSSNNNLEIKMVSLATSFTTESTSVGTSSTYRFSNFTEDKNRIYKLDLLDKSIDAIGFTWNSGSFMYSFDNVNFISPGIEMEDEIGGNGTRYSSDLVFISASSRVVYLKNQGANNLQVHTVSANDEGFVTSSASGNKYFGAQYSSLPIISRAEWGADESKALWMPRYGPIEKIIIHHTAGSNTSSNWASVVRAIFIYHAVTLDWGDIGYNFLIDPNGVVYEGRKGGDGVTAAHARYYNYGSIGISMMGTYSYELPTASAQSSLRHLVAEKAELHDLSVKYLQTLYGHRDFNATSCPGDALYGRIFQLAFEIDQYRINNMMLVAETTNKTVVDQTDWEQSTGKGGADLLVTFNLPANVSKVEVERLIPVYSGIDKVTVVGNKAYLQLIDYKFDNGEPMLFRQNYLYTYFNLRSDVISVELVSDYKITPVDVLQP